ncbi:MAG: HD domain-containing protein [Treponema sp.]|nr:HD domain-containing protein [Treponema sp.]
MLDRDLVLKIFTGFSIQRWNDLIHPFPMIEMDKAAEKMVLAYIIGKYEEQKGNAIDWEWMIYASFFDLLRKIAVCDIKSSVTHILKAQFPNEFTKLHEWALNQYRSVIHDDDLFSRFTLYIGQSTGTIPLNDVQKFTNRVYRAAHKFATLREVQMMACVNEPARLEKVTKDLQSDVQQYMDFEAVQLLSAHQRPFEFLLKVEQLRFQCRWNLTPRVPQTTVLGHCFFVALISLLLIRETKVLLSSRRLFDIFFSGLFHDLPEAITGDIISPVKRATEALPAIIKQIEDEMVLHQLEPLMEPFYVDELHYFMNDEFDNRVRDGNQIKIVTWDELNASYNDDVYMPVDGTLVRVADHISALLEADLSIKYGISSDQLVNGRKFVLHTYPAGKLISGIDAGAFMRELIA